MADNFDDVRPGTGWGELRRLLLVRLENLGDLLMTTPALAALRGALPDAELTLLCSPAGAALAPHLPMVDDVISFDAPWVQSAAPAGGAGGEATALAELASRLVKRQFDAAIVFTACTQSALPAAMLCRLAAIPRVLAYSRENPYRLISDRVADPDLDPANARHEVQRQLALLAQVGLADPTALAPPKLQVAVLDVHRQALQRRLRRARFAAGLSIVNEAFAGYVVVHPGAGAASRRWPAERFGTSAAQIAAASGLVPVVVGAAAEAPLVREVLLAARAAQRGSGAPPPLALIGDDLPLGELLALIEGAALVVCNNSGPAHIAAALQRPVVVLYALTHPQRTPWQVPSRVLFQDVPCRNCLRSRCPLMHHQCLLGVAPEQASAAALELLLLQQAPAARRVPVADAPRLDAR